LHSPVASGAAVRVGASSNQRWTKISQIRDAARETKTW
jgi:hypothetical protein